LEELIKNDSFINTHICRLHRFQITFSNFNEDDFIDFSFNSRYCKDIIILSILTQLLGLISAYFFLLLLISPGFAAYKLWVNILAPWFFAPAPEVDENDAGNKRKQKKREKTVYVRR
jgi:hypothetical protein